MQETSPSSRELVRRCLRGLPAPRCPTGPLAVHYCAGLARVSLRDYTLNPELLAESVIRYSERFRPDVVWLSADTWVTAQAMGAPVAFPGEDQPLAGTGEPLVRSAADVDRIPPPDPATQGRWPLMLAALREIRAAVGNNIFVVACFDQYPFSLACALMGLENLLTVSSENFRLVEALLRKCGEYTVAYAQALADNGADMLSGGDSPAGLLGPNRYCELALPSEEQVIAELKSRCSVPVSLHVCGNATPILKQMVQSGADVLELDHKVDLAQAARVVGPKIALWGNLDPVGLLAQGTPKAVHQTAVSLVQTMAREGHSRFVLSSGCTLAIETPAENLDALFDAAKGASTISASVLRRV